MYRRLFLCIFLILAVQSIADALVVTDGKFTYRKISFVTCTDSRKLYDECLIYSDPGKNHEIKDPSSIRTTTFDAVVSRSVTGINELRSSVNGVIADAMTRKELNLYLVDDMYFLIDENGTYIYTTLLINNGWDIGSLGYFRYSLDNEEIIRTRKFLDPRLYDIMLGELIFPKISCTGLGDTVRIGPFNKGEVISFYIVPDGWILPEDGFKKNIFPALRTGSLKKYSDYFVHYSWFYMKNFGCVTMAFRARDLNFYNYIFTVSVQGKAIINDIPVVDEGVSVRCRNATLKFQNRFIYGCYIYSLLTDQDQTCKDHLSIPPGWKWVGYDYSRLAGLMRAAKELNSRYPDHCFLFNEKIDELGGYKGLRLDGRECNGTVDNYRNACYFSDCSKSFIVLVSDRVVCRSKGAACTTGAGSTKIVVGDNLRYYPSSIELTILDREKRCYDRLISIRRTYMSATHAEVLLILDVGSNRRDYMHTKQLTEVLSKKFMSQYRFKSVKFNYALSGAYKWISTDGFTDNINTLTNIFNQDPGYYAQGAESNILRHASEIMTRTRWSHNRYRVVVIMTDSVIPQVDAMDTALVKKIVNTTLMVMMTTPLHNPLIKSFCDRCGVSCYYDSVSKTSKWPSLYGPYTIFLRDEKKVKDIFGNFSIITGFPKYPLDPTNCELMSAKRPLQSFSCDLCLSWSQEIPADTSSLTSYYIFPGWGKIKVDLKINGPPIFEKTNTYNINRNIGVNSKPVKIHWDVYDPEENLITLTLTKRPSYGELYYDRELKRTLNVTSFPSPTVLYYMPKKFIPPSPGKPYNESIVVSASDGCHVINGGALFINIHYIVAHPEASNGVIEVKMASRIDQVEPFYFTKITGHADNKEMNVGFLNFPIAGKVYDDDKPISSKYIGPVEKIAFKFVPNDDYHVEKTENILYYVTDGLNTSRASLTINIKKVNFPPKLTSDIYGFLYGEDSVKAFTLTASDYNYDETLGFYLVDAPVHDAFIYNNKKINSKDFITNCTNYETGTISIVIEWVPSSKIDDILEFNATFKVVDSTGLESSISIPFRIGKRIPLFAIGPEGIKDVFFGESVSMDIYGKYDGNTESITFTFLSIPIYGSLLYNGELINVNSTYVISERGEKNGSNPFVMKNIVYKSERITKEDKFSFYVKKNHGSMVSTVRIVVKKPLMKPESKNVTVYSRQGEKIFFSIVTDTENDVNFKLSINLTGNSDLFRNSFLSSSSLFRLTSEYMVSSISLPYTTKSVEFDFFPPSILYSENNDSMPDINYPAVVCYFFIEDIYCRSPTYSIKMFIEHVNSPPVVKDDDILVMKGQELLINLSSYTSDVDKFDTHTYTYYTLSSRGVNVYINGTNTTLDRIVSHSENSILYFLSKDHYSMSRSTEPFMSAVTIKYIAFDQEGANSEFGTIRIGVYAIGLQPKTSLTSINVLQDSRITIYWLDPNFITKENPRAAPFIKLTRLPEYGSLHSYSYSVKTKVGETFYGNEPIYYASDPWKWGNNLTSFGYILNDVYFNKSNNPLVEYSIEINVSRLMRSPTIEFVKPDLELIYDDFYNVFAYGDTVEFHIIVRDVDSLPENLRMEIKYSQIVGGDWKLLDKDGNVFEKDAVRSTVNIKPSSINNTLCPDLDSLNDLRGTKVDGCLVNYHVTFNSGKKVHGSPFIIFKFNVYDDDDISETKAIYLYITLMNEAPTIITPGVITYSQTNLVLLKNEDEPIIIDDDCKINMNLTLNLTLISGKGSFIIDTYMWCNKAVDTEQYICEGTIDNLNLWANSIKFNADFNNVLLELTINDNGCGGTFNNSIGKPYSKSSIIKLEYIKPQTLVLIQKTAIIVGSFVGVVVLLILCCILYERNFRAPDDSYFRLEAEYIESAPRSPLFKPRFLEHYNPIFKN